MKNLVVKKTAIFKIFMVFLVLIASFFIYNLFTATLTLSDLDNEIWDGVEVATSFSGGNGTKENPYQISNGSELAYLKKVVEEETLNDLKDTYILLANELLKLLTMKMIVLKTLNYFLQRPKKNTNIILFLIL